MGMTVIRESQQNHDSTSMSSTSEPSNAAKQTGTSEQAACYESQMCSSVVAFPMVTKRRLDAASNATKHMLAAFGLGGATSRSRTVSIVPSIPELIPSHIVLMTGPSGSGKSQSIRPLASQLGVKELAHPWAWPSDKPILDACGVQPKAAARLLGRVGLADAFTWARSYGELSVGQQARADLAMAIAHGPQVVVIDEWLANLDRMTARAVAWSTAKELRRSGMGALFVTAHVSIHARVKRATWRCGSTPIPR